MDCKRVEGNAQENQYVLLQNCGYTSELCDCGKLNIFDEGFTAHKWGLDPAPRDSEPPSPAIRNESKTAPEFSKVLM